VNDNFHKPIASALDNTRVDIHVADAGAPSIPTLISEVQNLALTVHTPARIVINERTGTIVLGGDVKLTPVSVIHGNLSIEVETTYTVAPVPGSAPPWGGGGWGGPGGPGRPDQQQAQQQGQPNGQQAANQGQPNQGQPGQGQPGQGQGGPGQQQGGPGSNGNFPNYPGEQAALVPQTNVTVTDNPAQTMRLDAGANVQELVNGLHAIGTTSRDVVAILQAIKAEGGIQAEVEVQ
jgi:flagellar P-ring protein precursor FlgI